jgi:hypothetical protein
MRTHFLGGQSNSLQSGLVLLPFFPWQVTFSFGGQSLEKPFKVKGTYEELLYTQSKVLRSILQIVKPFTSFISTSCFLHFIGFLS